MRKNIWLRQRLTFNVDGTANKELAACFVGSTPFRSILRARIPNPTHLLIVNNSGFWQPDL